jgi:hypothetical protein
VLTRWVGLPRIASAQISAGDNEETWFQAYLDWLRNTAPKLVERGGIPAVQRWYREHLASGGLTPSQIDQRWTYNPESDGLQKSRG